MAYMNTTEINARIDELEFKLQYQDDVIDSLNLALSNQQKELMLLNEKMQLIAKQMQSNRSQQIIQGDDTPPHY